MGIRVFGACLGLTIAFLAGSPPARSQNTILIANQVAGRFMATHPAEKLNWDWGAAVFLHGLSVLAKQSGPVSGQYLHYIHDYHEHWREKGAPAIDRSDRCPPALSGLELERVWGDDRAMPNVRKVVEYIESEPRNRIGALNHLGHSWLRALFPDSIWVDSLMMVSVFAAKWGSYAHDAEFTGFAASQPLIYASVLQDRGTGLFRHAWLEESGATVPASRTFWLRGNGWVLVAISEILDELPADAAERPELLEVFRRLSKGLLGYQKASGLWGTIANAPREFYEETSGSAMVAYAWARAAHRGWLPPEYLEAAKRAFAGIVSHKLLRESNGLSLTGISGNTNPGPRWLYGLVPRVRDAPYGVGPFLMAAVELQKDLEDQE